MPDPTRDELYELIEKAIKAIIRALKAGDHTFEPTDSKTENKSLLGEMWEGVGGYFGRGMSGFLEDNTEDVSEWVSDLFGALEELGTNRYQDLAEITTWAIYTERANEEGWESADLYTAIFCERVFGILGSSDFEKESIKDCNNSYKPDAEDEVDEAYDDWWSGEYGTGA